MTGEDKELYIANVYYNYLVLIEICPYIVSSEISDI